MALEEVPPPKRMQAENERQSKRQEDPLAGGLVEGRGLPRPRAMTSKRAAVIAVPSKSKEEQDEPQEGKQGVGMDEHKKPWRSVVFRLLL